MMGKCVQLCLNGKELMIFKQMTKYTKHSLNKCYVTEFDLCVRYYKVVTTIQNSMSYTRKIYRVIRKH